MTSMKVRLTFTEEVLGTSPADPQIAEKFVASKAPDAKSLKEEVEALGAEAVTESKMTVFPKENGHPFAWDYQIRGLFKGNCKACRNADGSKSKELKAYKTKIDEGVFVFPRKIPYSCKVSEMGECQRPLRAETMQGPRVALAHSETVPAGSTLEFTVTVMNKALMDYVREWLDFGQFVGFGQWRSGSKGRFVWDELDEDGKVIGGNNTDNEE